MSEQMLSAIAAIGSLLSAITALAVCILNARQNKIANKREQPNLLVEIPDNNSDAPLHWFFRHDNGDCIAAVLAVFTNPTKYPVVIKDCFLCVGTNRSIALQTYESFDLQSFPLKIRSSNGLDANPSNISFPLIIPPYGCIDSYAIFPTFIYSNTDEIITDFQVLATFGHPDQPLTIKGVSLYNLNNRYVDIPD